MQNFAKFHGSHSFVVLRQRDKEFGDKGREISSTWELGADEAKKLNTYYTKYEVYVKPKSNRVFARYKFHQKVQQDGESFEQFLTDLKLLVKDCGYGDPDEMV